MTNWYTMQGSDLYKYVDLKGNPVKRDPRTHTYNHDPFVVYKSPCWTDDDDLVYTDRMMMWNYDKFKNCCEQVWNSQCQLFSNRDPKDIQKFLSLYLDKEVSLTAIMQGCNLSNGYPYWIFYYGEV